MFSRSVGATQKDRLGEEVHESAKQTGSLLPSGRTEKELVETIDLDASSSFAAQSLRVRKL